MRAKLSLSRRGVVALFLWTIVIAAAATLLALQQRDSRRSIDARFALRAQIAGNFVATYVDDIVTHEEGQARRHLGGRDVSATQFGRVVTDDGFGAAVLLDARGRALRVYPDSPQLVGVDLAAKYEHLAGAVAGRVSISKVVPSAAEGVPIVGFAVPFDTPYGRRVYSGAQDVGHTAAGEYLRNAISLSGARLYLIDPAGTVIASNGAPETGVRTLADVDPALAADFARGPDGTFARDGEAQRYVSHDIKDTPWRVVVSAPSRLLYASVNGAATWLPWLVFGGFALVSLAAIGLVARLAESRRQLAGAVEALREAIRIDPLTQLANRRGLDEQLMRTVSASRRHAQPLALMMIDVDHFKQLNDTHGHLTGDAVLSALGDLMDQMLRAEDLVGRYGGEEFLAILPDTALEDAFALAERLRSTIAALTFLGAHDEVVSVTVSIGVSADVHATAKDRIAAADRALYAAKAAGRNRVVADGAAALAETLALDA